MSIFIDGGHIGSKIENLQILDTAPTNAALIYFNGTNADLISFTFDGNGGIVANGYIVESFGTYELIFGDINDVFLAPIILVTIARSGDFDEYEQDYIWPSEGLAIPIVSHIISNDAAYRYDKLGRLIPDNIIGKESLAFGSNSFFRNSFKTYPTAGISNLKTHLVNTYEAQDILSSFFFGFILSNLPIGFYKFSQVWKNVDTDELIRISQFAIRATGSYETNLNLVINKQISPNTEIKSPDLPGWTNTERSGWDIADIDQPALGGQTFFNGQWQTVLGTIKPFNVLTYSLVTLASGQKALQFFGTPTEAGVYKINIPWFKGSDLYVNQVIIVVGNQTVNMGTLLFYKNQTVDRKLKYNGLNGGSNITLDFINAPIKDFYTSEADARALEVRVFGNTDRVGSYLCSWIVLLRGTLPQRLDFTVNVSEPVIPNRAIAAEQDVNFAETLDFTADIPGTISEVTVVFKSGTEPFLIATLLTGKTVLFAGKLSEAGYKDVTVYLKEQESGITWYFNLRVITNVIQFTKNLVRIIYGQSYDRYLKQLNIFIGNPGNYQYLTTKLFSPATVGQDIEVYVDDSINKKLFLRLQDQLPKLLTNDYELLSTQSTRVAISLNSYEETIANSSLITWSDFVLMYGMSPFMSPNAGDFLGYISNNNLFYSLRSGQRRIYAGQPEFLHYFAYEPFYLPGFDGYMVLRFRTYGIDASGETVINQIDLESWVDEQFGRPDFTNKMLRFPTHLKSNGDHIATSGFTQFRCELSYAATAPINLSEYIEICSCNYSLENEGFYPSRFYMFRTAIGTMEVLTTTGLRTDTNNVTKRTAQRVLTYGYNKQKGADYVSEAFSNVTFKQNTGYLDFDQQELLQELVASEEVYEVIDNVLYPIDITTKKLDFKQDNPDVDDLAEVFEGRYRFPGRLSLHK